VASVEVKERALAHAEQATLNAVAAAHSIHKEENKRTREAMLLTMHKELDAVRKKLTTDHNQERAEAKAAAAVLRESLEAELRRTSALLADAEQKAEGTFREVHHASSSSIIIIIVQILMKVQVHHKSTTSLPQVYHK
jgi:hypothetical protein